MKEAIYSVFLFLTRKFYRAKTSVCYSFYSWHFTQCLAHNRHTINVSLTDGLVDGWVKAGESDEAFFSFLLLKNLHIFFF